MRDAEVRNRGDLVSESRFVAGSGCCACSKYVVYYGAVIGIDALTLFFKTVLISVLIGCVLVYYIYYYLNGAGCEMWEA
jgi:hypothetical protein